MPPMSSVHETDDASASVQGGGVGGVLDMLANIPPRGTCRNPADGYSLPPLTWVRERYVEARRPTVIPVTGAVP